MFLFLTRFLNLSRNAFRQVFAFSRMAQVFTCYVMLSYKTKKLVQNVPLFDKVLEFVT